MSRWARNIDRSHRRIVDALEAAGCTVVSLAALGRGAPDLLVGLRGSTHLFEVKNPPGPKGGTHEKGQHLSDVQQVWHETWRGRPVVVVRDAEEALRAIGAIK